MAEDYPWNVPLCSVEDTPTEERSGKAPGCMTELQRAGFQLGGLVASKQLQYGDSVGKVGAIMRVLYPEGMPVHAYDDALLIVRVLDKLARIAQRGTDGKDLGGESPWSDIAGYGLLGARKDDRERDELARQAAVAGGAQALDRE